MLTDRGCVQQREIMPEYESLLVSVTIRVAIARLGDPMVSGIKGLRSSWITSSNISSFPLSIASVVSKMEIYLKSWAIITWSSAHRYFCELFIAPHKHRSDLRSWERFFFWMKSDDESWRCCRRQWSLLGLIWLFLLEEVRFLYVESN